MKEFEVINIEEFDFFIKWLGLILLKYVVSIRLLNVLNLVEVLRKIWECFNE